MTLRIAVDRTPYGWRWTLASKPMILCCSAKTYKTKINARRAAERFREHLRQKRIAIFDGPDNLDHWERVGRYVGTGAVK